MRRNPLNERYSSSDPHRLVALLLLNMAAFGAISLQAQSALHITAPAPGTIVNPGQALTVSVSANGVYQEIVIIGDGPLGFSPILSAPPYDFSFQIPQNLPAGAYQLTAAGMITPQQIVYSDPVEIDVEPADRVVLLTSQAQSLDFDLVGGQAPLRVIGTLASGSTMDLSRSSTIAYSSDNPSVATVSNSGIVTAVSPGNCWVNVNRVFSIPVTVEPPIAVAPASSVLHPSQTQQMLAVVRNASNNPAVVWSLRAGDSGGVDTNGLYTAPSSISTRASVQVTATSADDPTKSASSLLQLYPAVSVTVAPATATVRAKQSQQFLATVSNAAINSGVTWTISPALGNMSPSGLYTAPDSVTTGQTVAVTATSIEDPTQSATATITLRK